MDGVYAFAIVLSVYDLPLAKDWVDEGFGEYLHASFNQFSIALFIIAIVMIYWIQNNVLLGNLRETDNVHSSLAIMQIFLVLLMMLFQDVLLAFPEDPAALAITSILATLLGGLGAAGWWHASRHRLLLPSLGEQEVRGTQISLLAEPITALITIPFAFVSSLAWGLSWLSYPLVWVLIRKRRQPAHGQDSP